MGPDNVLLLEAIHTHGNPKTSEFSKLWDWDHNEVQGRAIPCPLHTGAHPGLERAWPGSGLTHAFHGLPRYGKLEEIFCQRFQAFPPLDPGHYCGALFHRPASDPVQASYLHGQGGATSQKGMSLCRQYFHFAKI